MFYDRKTVSGYDISLYIICMSIGPSVKSMIKVRLIDAIDQSNSELPVQLEKGRVYNLLLASVSGKRGSDHQEISSHVA